MVGDSGGKLAVRLRIASWVLRNWPLPRGADRAQALLASGTRGWPARGDVEFRYGRLVDVNLDAWPRGYRELLLRGVVDEGEVAVWRAAIRPGEDVVDGGANLGYWSLVAAATAGPRGRVFAFEPVPATADALERNVAASGASAVRVARAALAAQPGEVVMHLYDDDPCAGTASVGSMPGLNETATVRTPAVALDAFLAEHNARPVLVKLDLEGSETAALHGARELISGDEPPLLTVEYHETAASGVGTHPREWMELLREAGYGFYLARRHGRLRPFAVPEGTRDWIPMVWCVPRSGRLRQRVAHLLSD
jgi:FkbM family methyltransferase